MDEGRKRVLLIAAAILAARKLAAYDGVKRHDMRHSRCGPMGGLLRRAIAKPLSTFDSAPPSGLFLFEFSPLR
jgi:hypothetical protein